AAANDARITPADRAEVWLRIAGEIRSALSGETWKLQDLTDLSVMPDYEPGSPWVLGRIGWPVQQKGAPVDADGQPVFHRLPDSWETAASDGERWRWALSEAAKLNPDRRSEIELVWAEFLQSQFGTGSGGAHLHPPVVPLGKQSDTSETPRETTLQNAHLLPDQETIAKLATGVRRFSLPDEFNCIVAAQAIVSRRDAQQARALELLIHERMQRHQYPQAAALLRELLNAVPNDQRDGVQQRIQQIEGNWLQLESSRTLPAGKAAVFDIRFRNGSKVAFEASPIRIEKLLADLQQYLKSSPADFDWRRTSPQEIGWRLLSEGGAQYLEPVAEQWTVELQPPAGHFDARQSIESPLRKAGAWWIRAKLENGNESRMVLWLADLAIARRQVEGGTLNFVADAVTGAPVKADLEFFGWSFNYIDQQNRIKTSRFADRTDADGIRIADPGQLKADHQWLTIARSADGRLAFHGFSNAWNPTDFQPIDWAPLKVYSVTDRPVYRPGHSVKFRIWARKPQFVGEDNSYAERDCWIQIRNPQGEVVFEKEGKTDRWAGIDGEWQLPTDAQLGSYFIGLAENRTVEIQVEENGRLKTIRQQQRDVIGGGSFVVEEYRKPEYEVLVDAPEKPVKLGEKVPITITAKYYFGSPVTQGRVRYRIERTKEDQRWFPVARWDWLYSPGYWWFAPEYSWYPGFSRWGCLPPIRPWWNWNPDPPELVAEGDAPIGPDGTFSVELDTTPALEAHGDSDHRYKVTAEVVDLSRRTIFGSGDVIVARDPYRVFTWTDRGHYQTGDPVTLHFQARTPDGKPVAATGRAVLYSVTYNESDLPSEQEVQAWDVTTDAEGAGSQKIEVQQPGQYRFSVKLRDAAGHEQEGASVLFVRGAGNNGQDYRFNDLELITDRKEYQPGDVVRLQINTDQPDSTVLLFIRAQDGVCPAPQVLKLQGKSIQHEFRIADSDMPNIFVEAITIANGRVHNELREIVVPPGQRVVDVDVQPDAPQHRPGEAATIRLKLTDPSGKPITGNVTAAVYDASLEYIAASAIPEIRSFFWDVRRYHGLGVDSSLQRTSHQSLREGEVGMQPLFGAEGGPGEHGLLMARGRRGRMPGGPAMMMADGMAPAMAEAA
ncbi:MAG: hypothetical protein RL215_958, partial [Planctomycetota bacterium]